MDRVKVTRTSIFFDGNQETQQKKSRKKEEKNDNIHNSLKDKEQFFYIFP